VDSALDVLERLVEKYLRLFGDSGNLLPSIIVDWKGVFMEPWIVPNPSTRARIAPPLGVGHTNP